MSTILYKFIKNKTQTNIWVRLLKIRLLYNSTYRLSQNNSGVLIQVHRNRHSKERIYTHPQQGL